MIRRLKYIDKSLLIVTVMLLIFGTIMVFSASNIIAYISREVAPYYYFKKQVQFIVLGFFLSIFMLIFLRIKQIAKMSYLFLFLITVALIYLLISGNVEATNSAKSWFNLGFVKFQPSEFAKIFTIFSLAYYYDLHKNGLNKIGTLLLPIFITGFIGLLIFLEPDLGTAIIYFGIVGFIFLSQPMPKKYKFIIYGLIILVVFLLSILISTGQIKHILTDRQMGRITEFKNPCSKILSTGNQVCNSYIAINNGNLTGVGLGNSTQKYLYLPEPYTDFIFAVLVEEFGLLGGIFLIFLYIFILYRILAIGRFSSTNLGTIICYGTALYIALHIFVNLIGIMGIAPMTGVTLPFISYGGSFTLCLILLLAAVQLVAIENKTQK